MTTYQCVALHAVAQPLQHLNGAQLTHPAVHTLKYQAPALCIAQPGCVSCAWNAARCKAGAPRCMRALGMRRTMVATRQCWCRMGHGMSCAVRSRMGWDSTPPVVRTCNRSHGRSACRPCPACAACLSGSLLAPCPGVPAVQQNSWRGAHACSQHVHARVALVRCCMA